MNYSFLLENEKKRKHYPLWMLLCFAAFCFWQMGFIYFVGPALTIDGRTPLPISMDNVTMLIVVAYVCSIIYMIILPRQVIRAARITTAVTLVSALGLFFPFSDEVLRLLIYLQMFCCCFMIGFETFVMVNYFSEQVTIRHLTVAYGVAVLLISVVQNDFALISFPHFRILTVIAVSLLLLFFCRMPAGKDACPRYVTKESGLVKPKKLLYGTYVLEFVSALMAVSGPSISDGIKNGVFITYLMDMAASFGIYFLYKKAKIHPFRSISICIGVGCIGFLLMLVVPYLPFMAYVSCAFIGVGMVPCQMIPLYNVMLMKNYPSRYLPPIAIGLAMAAVLVQSSLVEIFRDAPHLLYLTYSVIMVILVIIYLQIEPHFFYAMRRKLEHRAQREAVATEMAQEMKEKSEVVAGQKAVESEITENSGAQSDNVFDVLSKREKEVVDLIASGYSNAEIASALFISPHTVNDHTKKIYRKLDVHSRYELTALVNKMKTDISF